MTATGGGEPLAMDLERLDDRAPDVVAAWRGIEVGAFLSVRREVRRRAGPGTAAGIAAQLAAVAEALADVVGRLPEAAFSEPGGEADWTVAEAIGHTARARAWLALAAARAASGTFPAGGATVVPGVPGPPDEGREALLHRLASSQRVCERAARSIAGHEADPCPLDHPLVGRLRCGEWLLFAGVHDLMHLEQLEAIGAGVAILRPDLEPAR